MRAPTSGDAEPARGSTPGSCRGDRCDRGTCVILPVCHGCSISGHPAGSRPSGLPACHWDRSSRCPRPAGAPADVAASRSAASTVGGQTSLMVPAPPPRGVLRRRPGARHRGLPRRLEPCPSGSSPAAARGRRAAGHRRRTVGRVAPAAPSVSHGMLGKAGGVPHLVTGTVHGAHQGAPGNRHRIAHEGHRTEGGALDVDGREAAERGGDGVDASRAVHPLDVQRGLRECGPHTWYSPARVVVGRRRRMPAGDARTCARRGTREAPAFAPSTRLVVPVGIAAPVSQDRVAS